MEFEPPEMAFSGAVLDRNKNVEKTEVVVIGTGDQNVSLRSVFGPAELHPLASLHSEGIGR